jgi:hypothetical protein
MKMKKFFPVLAIMMTFVLLGGALASAETTATWSNGQSPQQPYKGVPPVDLTKKLGYMVLDPLNNENVDPAVNVLNIYLPRDDVKAGAGTLKLYEAGVREPIQEISFADGARVIVSPIGAEALAWLYWESGTQFTVTLDNSLDADKTYTASLGANSIVAPDYGIGNTALDGAKGWTFTTHIDAGVIKRTRSGEAVPRVGDKVTVDIKLGNAVASAMIFCESEALVSEDEPLTQSGVLTGRYVKDGPVNWGVALMDTYGQLISVYHYNEQVLPQ